MEAFLVRSIIPFNGWQNKVVNHKLLIQDDQLLGYPFTFRVSLCQRLDSRQLTEIRAPEARGKSSAKRERERRRRESPPEAKGERSEPFAGGARDSAKLNRVFVIMAKFLSPSSHVTCRNWIRPLTKKHRFIAQIDSARSNIASTAWRPCGLSPDIGESSSRKCPLHVAARYF